MVNTICNKMHLFLGGVALHRGHEREERGEVGAEGTDGPDKSQRHNLNAPYLDAGGDLEFEERVPTPPSNSRFRKLLKSAT